MQGRSVGLHCVHAGGELGTRATSGCFGKGLVQITPLCLECLWFVLVSLLFELNLKYIKKFEINKEIKKNLQ